MPNNKRTIYVASAIWENNGKHYKQDYVICAINYDEAKSKIEKKLLNIASRPNINLHSMADKVDSPIDKTYFTSEAIPLVDPTGTNTYLMETISELTMLWGQEIGWRKNNHELTDGDKLCLDKLINASDKTELIVKWANEFCDQNGTDINDFFIRKLTQFIGAEISTVDDMKPIGEGQYSRIMREAQEEANRIVQKAEQEAVEKTKQIDKQIKAMVDIIKNLEDITKNGIVVKTETAASEEQASQPSETDTQDDNQEYDIPDDNGEELTPETADSDYIEFDNENQTVPSEETQVTQSEFDETPSTELANDNIKVNIQPENNDYNEGQLKESENEIEFENQNEAVEPQQDNNNSQQDDDDDVPEVTEQHPPVDTRKIPQEAIISALKRITPKHLIEHLKRMTCVVQDRNHNSQTINGYDSYLMYCKQYGKQAEPYRFEIIIQILKACMPINGKSAIRYLYDLFLSEDSEENF